MTVKMHPDFTRVLTCTGEDGRTFALVSSDERDPKRRTVGIYDLRYDFKSVPTTGGKLKGQFVSSYYLSTLLEHPVTSGLRMHMGEPVWTIPASEWPEIHEWLVWSSR